MRMYIIDLYQGSPGIWKYTSYIIPKRIISKKLLKSNDPIIPKINTTHHGKRKNAATKRMINRNLFMIINIRNVFAGKVYVKLQIQSQ
jgi:hypothetical protein